MTTLIEIVLSNAVVATLMALVVFALSRVLRRRPALVHVLWMLVLVKLITPPLFSIPVLTLPAEATLHETGQALDGAAVTEPKAAGVFLEEGPLAFLEEVPAEPLPTESVGRAEEAFSAAAETTLAQPTPAVAPPALQTADTLHLAPLLAHWPEALLGIWLMGCLLWLIITAVRVRQFRGALRHAWPAESEMQERADYLANRLGLRRSPSVWLAPGAVSPMLWAVGLRSKLILPVELVTRLRPGHVDTLLLHELAHLRRRDHWVRWLELVVTGLWWWHPIVWWARRELREVEEQCCDAWVLWALPQAGRSYALALVETVDFLSETRPVLPLAASGFGQVHDLKRRLTMIMRGNTPRTLTWLSALAVVGLGAALLAVRPTFADEDEKRPPGRGEGRERREDDKRRADPEKRPARPDGERDTARPGGEEVERARNQVRELGEHLQKMQREVQEVAQKLKQAQEQLSRMEGRGGSEGGEGGGRARAPGFNPFGGAGGRGGFGGYPGGPGAPGAAGGFGGAFPGAPGQGGGGDVDRRLNELERKLDRLLQMMERGRDGQPPTERRDAPTRRDGEERGRGALERALERAPDAPRPPVAPPPPGIPRRGGGEAEKRPPGAVREAGGAR